MKPFALYTVLDYRKRQEDTARQRFAEARKVMDTVANRLHDEQDMLNALIRKKELLEKKGINILELVLYEEQITKVIANVKAIEKNLKDKTEIMRKEQQNLVRRAKDRRIMERLKERQDLAWKGYLDKKEMSMLDEVAITRHDSEKIK